MKVSILRIAGGTLMILNCCAVAFGGFLAWVGLGGDQGSWPMQMPTLRESLKSGGEVSAAIGAGAIALGF